MTADGMKETENILSSLFFDWAGRKPESVTPLPPSGSSRKYYRLAAPGVAAVGSVNPTDEENRAFHHFTEVFRSQGVPVAEIYASNPGAGAFLLEDLGDVSLFSLITAEESRDGLSPQASMILKKSLEQLVRIQTAAGRQIDYSICYPRAKFDRRSVMWDLNYFKYYFLKLHGGFHEDRLEDDLEALADRIAAVDSEYFMYRDFQSRNIMVKEDSPYFIDFQGGRKGPLQYDVVSLLFQVKAGLTPETREEMLGHYLDALRKSARIDEEKFRKEYDLFILVRLLQVLGAYGFRGLIERKAHFLESIPHALKMLQWWLLQDRNPGEFPELRDALVRMSGPAFQAVSKDKDKLTLRIFSFSYKNGLPPDPTIHGGGFLFDCRSLPNPGREEKYRSFTGRDTVIREYLERQPEVGVFLEGSLQMLENAVNNYLDRGFSYLSAGFGCTGGRHRSVYCAETAAKALCEKFPQVAIVLEHLNI